MCLSVSLFANPANMLFIFTLKHLYRCQGRIFFTCECPERRYHEIGAIVGGGVGRCSYSYLNTVHAPDMERYRIAYSVQGTLNPDII